MIAKVDWTDGVNIGIMFFPNPSTNGSVIRPHIFNKYLSPSSHILMHPHLNLLPPNGIGFMCFEHVFTLMKIFRVIFVIKKFFGLVFKKKKLREFS